MQIIKIADMHLGYPGKTEHTLWAARKTLKLAKHIGCNLIIGHGDLFDNRDAIPLEALYAAHEIFKESKELGIEWIWFPGNHDMHMKHDWGNHSLLSVNKHVEIIDKPSTITIDSVPFIILPYIHNHDAYNQVLAELATKAPEDAILLTHVGTNKARLNSCFLSKNWSDTNLDETSFRRVYTGHYHIHQQVGDNTWYIGSPIPLRSEEGGVPHGVIIFDTKTRDHKFVDLMSIKDPNRPPDYITIIGQEAIAGAKIARNHIRIVLDHSITEGEKAAIRSELIDNSGALSVKFTIKEAKSTDIVVATSYEASTNIHSLFPTFLDDRKINLEPYNKDKLLRFNNEIVEDALARMAERESVDE